LINLFYKCVVNGNFKFKILYDLFRAALANNRINLVKAITKSIDPSHLYDALKAILETNCIESEGYTTNRGYAELIEVTINSLSPEQHLSEVFPIVALNYASLT
jgi:hypothetical protein